MAASPKTAKTRKIYKATLAGRDYAPYFGLVLAVLAVYSNVYNNEFVYDDEQFITNNAFLRDWHSLGAIFTSSATAGAGGFDLFYRPLQALLYLTISQLFGQSEPVFHVLNVALHAANACLLYALGSRLNFKPVAVFLAALLWAVHPLHTEAIAYMSSTVDPLYSFFCLLGLQVLLSDFSPRKYILVCPLYLLALFSKETAIIFLPLALVTQFYLSKDRLNPRIYLRAWPLLLTAGAYFLLRHEMLGTGYDFFNQQDNVYSEHISYRFYTFLATLPLYAKLLVWPTCLHLDRKFPVYLDPWTVQVYVGAAILILAIAQLMWGRGKRGLALGWGILWFAAAHTLQTGVLLPINGVFFEHWMYLPTAGLFLGLAQSIAVWLEKSPPRRKFERPIATLAVIAALGFGWRTIEQNSIWRSPLSLCTHIVECGTSSARVYNNLGNAYLMEGEVSKAIEQFHIAISIDDDYPQTQHNLALALLSLPNRDAHIDEAVAHLKRAVELDSQFFQSWEMLANIANYRGHYVEETYYRAKSLELRDTFHIPEDEYRQPTLQ